MLKCVIYRSPALALFWAFSRVIPGSPLITKTAVLGRVAAKEPEANAKRKATQRVNTQAAWDWKPSDQPAWLTKHYYTETILPILSLTPRSAIADLMKVSFSYASDIRKGRIPHPRRWLALAEMAGVNCK